MRVVLVFVALITLGLIATVGCGESAPTPTPTQTPQEVYLKSVNRWAFQLEINLGERAIYSEAAIDPMSVLEAATLDPLTSERPSWMSNFDIMFSAIEIFLDSSSTYAFKGVPVPSIERRAERIKDQLRTMVREYESWKTDPYGNTDAFEGLAEVHVSAFSAVGQLKLDAIKAMNTGEY